MAWAAGPSIRTGRTAARRSRRDHHRAHRRRRQGRTPRRWPSRANIEPWRKAGCALGGEIARSPPGRAVGPGGGRRRPARMPDAALHSLDIGNLMEGGAERAESIRNGLAQIDGDAVLVHDAARPFCRSGRSTNCWRAWRLAGGWSAECWRIGDCSLARIGETSASRLVRPRCLATCKPRRPSGWLR